MTYRYCPGKCPKCNTVGVGRAKYMHLPDSLWCGKCQQHFFDVEMTPNRDPSDPTEFDKLNKLSLRLMAAKDELDRCRDDFLAAAGDKSGRCSGCGCLEGECHYDDCTTLPVMPEDIPAKPDRLAELREKYTKTFDPLYSNEFKCHVVDNEIAGDARRDINELIEMVERQNKKIVGWTRLNEQFIEADKRKANEIDKLKAELEAEDGR